MSGDGEETTIRRILVALDASPHSLAALEAAVDLAAQLDADLVGVFVEDVNLLRLARLPFAREVTRFPVIVRQLESVQIERQLKVRARRARKALVEQAARVGIRWSFRVERGEINPVLLKAASEADLIFVGRSGWSRQRGVGSTARAMMSEAPTFALMLHRGVHLGLPVLVVYGGTPASRKALKAAGPLVRGRSGFLTVLIVAEDDDQARRLQADASERLRADGLEARFRWLLHGDLARLADVVHSEMRCVVVLPSDDPMLQGQLADELLEGLVCPVLVAR